MARRDRDEDAQRETPPEPWHNRTSTLLGASVAGLAAVAILIGSIGYVARQFNEPEQAPTNYVEPAFSATKAESSTPTTTQTITTTMPPITSDINPDLTPSSSTDPSSTSRNPSLRPPRTKEDPSDDEATTTRKRPRTNVTRTLYPGQ